MTQTAKISIAYTGAAVDDGTMSVNDLAPALLALSNLIGSANRILNQDDSTIEVRLSANVQHGSFEMSLELVRTFSEQIKLFFTEHFSINEILYALGLISNVSSVSGLNLLELYRWIKGRRIQKVETVSKDNVKITIAEDSKTVSIATWKIFSSQETHRHIEGIIHPLTKEGVESFEVRNSDNQQTIEKISCDETEYFSSANFAESLEEIKSSQKLILKIVSVNFERGLKWRFDDGESKFYAEIKDENFLNAVENGNISFAQGDIIIAEVETIQQHTNGELRKTGKTITKVFKVVKRSEQL